jgi:membrane protein implicated in regulation of membrane protease activity
MPIWLKATGKWGSILVLIALVTAFLKQLIAFVGFLTFAIKAIIFFAFAALFVAVGYLIFRTWKENQQRKSKS